MKLVKMVGSIALAASACWRTSAPPPTAPVAQEASVDEPSEDGSAHKARDLVQPVRIEKQEYPVPLETGDVNGVEGGVVGGDLSGAVAAPPPPPPPPPSPPPQLVAPSALEALRIAGDKIILPDPDTRTEIIASGKDRLVGTYKLCVTASGNIQTVVQLKSTGFPAYDAKIRATIRDEWRYRPFLINGKPAAVCTAATFIYSRLPSPPPP
jgi:hypothetical protein